MSDPAAIGLAALGGGLAALAVAETVATSPVAARWLSEAIEPLRLAGREGRAPTELERRRLAILGTLAMLAAALVVVGPGPTSCSRAAR